MPSSCAVASCKNIYLKGSDVHFFHFPRANEKLKNVWIQKCYRKDKFNVSNGRVCSVHFTKDDFMNYVQYHMMGNVGKLLLKVGAIPSQNLQNAKDVSDTLTKQSKRYKRGKRRRLMDKVLQNEEIPIELKSSVCSNKGEALLIANNEKFKLKN